MKNLKLALASGKPAIGSWLNSASPIVAELMAASGFDFICIDAEHSAVDLPQTQQLFQAIRSGNPDCAAMVRLHGVDYALVKRYLDAGARGVVAPLVCSRKEAELLVRAIKYPPDGMRGLGFCRANNYGMRLMEETAVANNEILAAVQIEHISAVTQIDDILSVEGIDAAFIGPYDLSASMGIPGEFLHPDFLAVQEAILAACLRHKTFPGLHVVQPDADEVGRRYQEGYRFIAYSLDITMLTHACQTGLAEIRKQLP
ncbi:MAG: 4-hydroxy-2-oxovalerate aldolase [Opitutia bacterium UBA7350]|nr:MAG: 4-hydroxy-2-oxovalerate aldolase [Opitutae bacterium UBA7350]